MNLDIIFNEDGLNKGNCKDACNTITEEDSFKANVFISGKNLIMSGIDYKKVSQEEIKNVLDDLEGYSRAIGKTFVVANLTDEHMQLISVIK